MNNKYYKIGKKKDKYVVLKYKEYNRRYFITEMYFSKNIFDCIKFCKCSNYIMKGFVICD